MSLFSLYRVLDVPKHRAHKERQGLGAKACFRCRYHSLQLRTAAALVVVSVHPEQIVDASRIPTSPAVNVWVGVLCFAHVVFEACTLLLVFYACNN